MARSAQTTEGGLRRPDVGFFVEATTTRNEKLTREISAQTARTAKERATEQFMCEGHIILSAIASRVKGSKK